jgi:nicotinamide-nucleotide amidase
MSVGQWCCVEISKPHDVDVADRSGISGGPGPAAAFVDYRHGGVVAYVPEVKTELLGVSPQVLASGIVSEPVALAMARGAAERLGADVGVGTTGAAGPDSHDGAMPGTACIGVWTPNGERTQTVHVSGDRAHVRLEVTRITLEAIVGFIASRTN